MKQFGKRSRTYAALSLAVACWLAWPMYSVHAADGVITKAVEVKASRAEELAKQESQHTTIITKQDIEKKQAKSVEDIIFSEVGVSRTVDGMGRVGVSIRGAEPRHTLILVDGQPVMGDLAKYQGAGDELQRLGTENVDHIEIIQGAASAKYGSDAIGGVINVITNKPRKNPGIQVNVEGVWEKGNSDLFPFTNVFMRADSGKMGNVRINVFGSKRDIMPVYASRERRSTFLGPGEENHGFLKNSLRYYGTNSNIGLASTIDINKNNSIGVRIDRYNEDLERYVKRSDSYLEPQVHYKRDLNRNNMNLTYTGKDEVSNWKAEINYTRTTEDDVTLTSDYGNSTYEGKNTLNYVDNVDHKQWNASFSGDIQVNDNHLLSYGVGMSKENGSGSRLKNAPDVYVRKINPWDYDKSLAVNRGIPSSTVYNYSFKDNEVGVPQWDKEKEWYNGDITKPETLPDFTYEEYVTYADPTAGYDPAAVKGLVDGTNTENTLKKRNPEAYARYQQFAKRLAADNAEFLAKRAEQVKNKEIDPATGQVYSNIDVDYLPSYYYGAVEGFDASQIKFNGAGFKEEYNKRVNEQKVGSAEIKKQYVYVQDTWQLNKDTTLAPILRLDHSDLFGSNLSFNVGMTHNVNGNTHRRLKTNVGTSYTEPGMGELYYNWEMYGSNITAATIGGGEARLGWYWVGNPNLKPEKAVNFDISFEGENKNTYSKVSLFRNNIKDYMTVFNTGYLMDFNPQLTEDTWLGATKYAHAPDMIYSFRNIGKAEITGLEWELQQKISDQWKLKFGYTYLHAINKSNADMPRQLLDKPTHKVDIGIDFKDKKSGWSASLWGDYYIRMLDSNSVSGGGNYMVSYINPDNKDKSVIRYNLNNRRSSDMYERKTFGIWNFMLQKQLNKDAKVYFGVNNIFDHRDDDRALSTRQYRVGVNLKFGSSGMDDKKKKAATLQGESNTHKVGMSSMNGADTMAMTDTISSESVAAMANRTEGVTKLQDFITRPFDESKKKGVEVVGDYRARWDSHLGSDRPDNRITFDSYVDDGATKNLRDKAEHGMTNRLRVGVDARVGDNTDIRVVGSASGQGGVDTSHNLQDRSKGFNNQRLDEATITQHTNHWDFTAGRMTESMGVTGYWFGKEYDGARAVWTNGGSQIRVGYGDFRHSTGITDSAYTHAVYDAFKRAPTVDEFVGTKLGPTGGRVEEVVPGAGDTIGFYQQLKAIKDKEEAAVAAAQENIQNIIAPLVAEKDRLEAKMNELIDEENYEEANKYSAEADAMKERIETEQEKAAYEVRAPFIAQEMEVMKKLQAIATEAYPKEMGETDFALNVVPIKATYTITKPKVIPGEPIFDEADPDHLFGPIGYGPAVEVPGEFETETKTVSITPARSTPIFNVKFNNEQLFDNDGTAYIQSWYSNNKEAIKRAYQELAEKTKSESYEGYTLSIDDSQFDSLGNQFVYDNTGKMLSGDQGRIRVEGGRTYPHIISSYFNSLTNLLTKADGYSPLPREALGRYTGLVVPAQGIVLKRDVIPAIKRAGFVQFKQQVSNEFGVSAWYLRSMGSENHNVYFANGNGTDSMSFDRLAHVIGIGAKYQIGNNASVSFDYGQNRTDFGRYMNGGSNYEYVGGSRQYAVVGHHPGSTPKFWALRFDVGKSDLNLPGTWNAFLDYKYFEHGSFFGGNGTESLPDRYLDGIKSFTFGGGYVPKKDVLLQAFYTFGAKGIGKRDTLYGAENFKLGNYTRLQMMYKF